MEAPLNLQITTASTATGINELKLTVPLFLLPVQMELLLAVLMENRALSLVVQIVSPPSVPNPNKVEIGDARSKKSSCLV